RRLEAGAATRGDLDRLVRDALQDEQQLHDARRRASLARSALAVAVGVPVKVLESLKVGWEQLDDPPAFDAPLLERARDDALLARADVHGAVVAYGMAERALRLEVARQYPDVHLGPAYTWDHGVRRYQFNLGLTLPLLNRNAGAIGDAEARREEAGAHRPGGARNPRGCAAPAARRSGGHAHRSPGVPACGQRGSPEMTRYARVRRSLGVLLVLTIGAGGAGYAHGGDAPPQPITLS